MDTVFVPESGPDTGDPRRPTLEAAIERIEDAEGWVTDKRARLQRLAEVSGDLSFVMSEERLTEIGAKAVSDYEQDKTDRSEWEEIARDGLAAARQARATERKTYPWSGASNIDFPLLTTAMLQWNARMYPAVIKGDEAVLCKVVGQDNGKPVMAPNPNHGQMQPIPQMQPGPEGQPAPVLGADGEPVPQWEVPPGAKAKRARRVSEYLNTVLFYRMEGWESDTDTLLMQLPAVGCAFRKCWYDPDLGARSALVPALRIFVPKGVSDIRTTPRLTEEVPDVFPYQISQAMVAGRYRDVDLNLDPNEGGKGRLLLEHHCLLDMDEDGLEEPYIATVDHATRQVLRIEANFGAEDVRTVEDRVVEVRRRQFFVKYGLFPDPEGGFYDLGLAHLLKHLGAVVNTALNQLIDAGTAQTAGGGFIGSGVRLQTRGNRGVLRWEPGEYKTVDVSGETLRQNIVERTLPNVSPVTFQVLDMILGATRDITGAKDVMTGEASNNGQVGTTLALIEQGLQVFNATAKRCFRSFKSEFRLHYENIGRFGGDTAAQNYLDTLDDPEADFAADFNAKDLDIAPVSDPSTVTRMQKMAKAQFVMGTMGMLATVGGDPREALRRVYEAVDLEDIDKLLPPPKPQQADPLQQAMAQIQMAALQAKANKDAAGADKAAAEAAETILQAQKIKYGLAKEAMTDGMALGSVTHDAEMGNG